VFALAVAQPLALELFGTRTAAQTGAVSVASHSLSLAGRAMNIGMVVVAATLLVAPGARVGRGGRLLVSGVWAMAAALFVANFFSPASGSVQYAFYFAAALTAVALGAPDRATLLRWARLATRVVVAVSLGSTVVAPTWAFIGQGSQGYDRTIFGVPRLTGLSPHPNALAAVAVIALLVEVGFRHGSRTARLAGAAAAATCLVLTQSNTGYIAAALAVAIMLASRHAAYRRLLLTACVAVLAVYVVSPTTVVPASVQSSDYVSSVSGRTVIWSISLGAWQRRPLTGYGPGFFSPASVEQRFPETLQVTNGHDQLVQTLVESGLLGLLGLATVFAATIACAWRARRVDGGLSLALVTSFWIFGITETPMRVVGVAAVPALVTLAVALVAGRDSLAASLAEQPEPLRAQPLPAVAR
jgi:O-antigen ligase